MNPIILENYITILRAGAFRSKDNEIIPMSLHKWHVLGKMAKEHHVQDFLSDGIKHIKESHNPDLPDIDIIEKLKQKYILYPICPEVFGGLSIPRSPSEINGNKVISKEGIDVTSNFLLGANKSLDISHPTSQKENGKNCVKKR